MVFTTKNWSFALCSGLLLILAAVTNGQDEISGAYYNPHNVPVDPANVIHSVTITKEGRFADYRKAELAQKYVLRTEFPKLPKYDDARAEKPKKVSPVLEQWFENKRPDEKVEVIVRLRNDETRIPLMPRPEPGRDREQLVKQRSEIIERIAKRRQASQARFTEQRRNLTVLENFWIVNAVALSARLGDLRELADSIEVVYIQPVEGGEKPPQDGNNNNDVQDGRRWIVSDPYFALSLTQPWIGILDTGIRTSHVLFNSPDHIALMADCVNGGSNCLNSSNPGFDPTDFAWNHGTSTAGIITGNNRLGNAFRGVTEIRLDSWQIYTAGGLNSAAAVRAIQQGVRWFDKVLVGELQASESETGAIATAADNAYDAGAIIVAANGNFGPAASTVRSPAIAHKVIGVGAFLTDGGGAVNYPGRGPATDGRYKPDVQAPTSSETASNSSNNALRVFGGTSGATPYASAAAMLARNWLNQFGTYDNGQTYAFMILYGQDAYPYDNAVGVGKLRMATNGTAWWGKLVVTDGQVYNLPISIGSGKEEFDAALWWPESASQAHNDIDVHLIDPGGTERARGYSAVSIFERARVAGSLSAGTWTLRIRGFRVQTAGQVVYWAAHVRN